MIKKALIIFALLCIVYSVAIRFIPEYLDTDQSQWGDNIIKSQRYLYDLKKTEIENVIIGSSLSNRIIVDSIGKNFTNLALIGLSFWDGIEMIKHKSIKPKIVYIETNMFFREESSSFQEYVFSKFTFKPKEYIPILREKNQPIGVLKGLLNQIKRQNVPVNLDSTIRTVPELLSMAIKEFSITPTPQKVDHLISKLHAEIKYLESQNIKVVFFEIPMEAPICNSSQIQLIRQKLGNFKTIPQIPKANCENYHTTDGLHLDPYYALKYAKYFKAQINSPKFAFNSSLSSK